MKWTPGPWEDVHCQGGFVGIRAKGGPVGGRFIGKIGFDCIGDTWACDETDRANARLIAAAPELAEACEAAYWLLDEIAGKLGMVTQGSSLDTLKIRTALQAALAKAKGE